MEHTDFENIEKGFEENSFLKEHRFMPQVDECVFKKCCKKYKKKGKHCKKCPKI